MHFWQIDTENMRLTSIYWIVDDVFLNLEIASNTQGIPSDLTMIQLNDGQMVELCSLEPEFVGLNLVMAMDVCIIGKQL